MMKRIVFAFLACVGLYATSGAQSIADTSTLRNYINSTIVPNSNHLITAPVLNLIENGHLNILPSLLSHYLPLNGAASRVSPIDSLPPSNNGVQIVSGNLVPQLANYRYHGLMPDSIYSRIDSLYRGLYFYQDTLSQMGNGQQILYSPSYSSGSLVAKTVEVANGFGAYTNPFDSGLQIIATPTTPGTAGTDSVVVFNAASNSLRHIGPTYYAHAVVASADLTGLNESATVASISGAAAHTYRVGGYITVTDISGGDALYLNVLWVDETGAARSKSFPVTGTASPSITTTGTYTFSPIEVRAAATEGVTLLVTLSSSSGAVTYDAGGDITLLR